jgi:PEP-CTERM motif
MRFTRSLLAAVLVLAASTLAAHADTFTYDFTYNGVGTYDTSVNASGTGTFTYTSTLGSTTAALTGFTFMNTLTSPSLGSSTYSYSGLTDVAGSSVVVNATTGLLANTTISTDYLLGTDAALGTVRFVLNYSPVVFDSTADSNGTGSYLQAFTTGGGTVTFAPTVASTPEPSSLILLGTGILGLAGTVRRKFLSQS